jgi:hypothetical protein
MAIAGLQGIFGRGPRSGADVVMIRARSTGSSALRVRAARQGRRAFSPEIAAMRKPKHAALKCDAAHSNLSYTLPRASLDVGFNAGPLRATASAAFRLPLGSGQISEQKWFPRMGGYGFEATVGLEYPISRVLDISTGASLRRYLLEMNSVPEDAMNLGEPGAFGASLSRRAAAAAHTSVSRLVMA